jgi:uroporphyrinogen-III synthase
MKAGEVSVVTFTSPSAMEGLRSGLGRETFLELARTVPAAAIGETTARALEEAGWVEIRIAAEATLEGLATVAVAAASGNDRTMD